MLLYTLLPKGGVSLALVTFVVLALSGVADVYAQENTKNGDSSRQTLKELISSSERVASFPAQRISNGRLEADANIMRSMYRIDGQLSSPFSGSPVQISEAFLKEQYQQFGLDESLSDLEVVRDISTDYSHHTTYQQHYRGVPVYGRFVKVNMNRRGEVTMVLNGYEPDLSRSYSQDVLPRISEQDAVEQAQRSLDLEIENTGQFELMVYPSESPRLVWRFVVWTKYPFLELEFLIDAKSGEFVATSHLSTHAHEAEELSSVTLGNSPSYAERLSSTSFVESLRLVNGTGLVFDPDPLTSSGNAYSPPFVDSDDTDIQEINQERKLVDLYDISEGSDGQFRLIGPHVQIVGESAGGSPIYTPPSESSPDGFRYSRSNSFFESVNSYYHIDKAQRYVQSLGIGRDIQNTSIRVNPHGLLQEDNSRYYSAQNFIAFGLGGVDDAEDAHVIWHEYGHALLQGSAPGLLFDNEGKALHEGWADYWAGSYARSLVEENMSPRADWPTLFKWDSGDGAIWAGRELTFSGKYPDDIFCDDGGFLCDIYMDGLFWASTLMQVYDEIGRTQTDRLALASHIYLSSPVTFQDAAEAIIQADVDLNNGENVDFLIGLFNDKGLINLDTFGPVIAHEPLVTTEQLGGTLPITVNANGISSSVDQVFAVYTHPGGVTDTLFLELIGGQTYSALLPLPDVSGEVSYYIGVSDELGLFTRDPDGDASSVYRFQVGPDLEPPVIIHNQLDSISLVEWPAKVEAEVQDNLGVSDVLVDFYIDNPFGVRIAEGIFPIEETGTGTYEGTFPTALEELLPASTVFYRIIATDSSQASNVSITPESGYLGFNIIIEDGLFRSYTFEDDLPNFAGAGLWERGEPEFGVRIAHSGSSAWGTTLSGAYSDVAQLSTLELPPMNLAGIENAYLVFWHWYDMEHAGEAQPDGSASAVLWDGGNMKVSIDDGITWQVITPEGGYNGSIASGRDNPLEGESAFGGFSYGWRKVIAPIPTGGMLRVRFDFGTDSGAGIGGSGHAGWLLDDLSILTELEEDSVMPDVLGLVQPEAVVNRMIGEPLPQPVLEVLDNVGVESVFVHYTLSNSGNEIEQSRFRLAMDSTQLNLFWGTFPFSESSNQVGDILEYTFVVSDFSGNISVFPENSAESFLVEFRLIEQQSLMLSAVPSGLWEVKPDTLVLEQRESHESISSLVFGPIELPSNADQIELSVTSSYEIDRTHGGNIKIALGDATQWELIEPIEGYTGTLPDDVNVPEAMRGQPVFTGRRESPQQATFLIEELAGNQVWIRADFAAENALDSDENWIIEDIVVRYSTLEPQDGGFAVPRAFTLYDNFPDPFSTTTTISYTLESASLVKLDVYDVLGRRVESLVQEDQAAGTYSLTFNASQLSSGVYFLRLETNQGQEVEKMLVTK